MQLPIKENQIHQNSSKRIINLSVNPTYHCNLRCSFCYLTKEQLGNKKKIDLSVLEKKLEEIKEHQEIGHIDLYGGEVFMLPEDYLDKLLSLLVKYTEEEINVVTNLTTNHPLMYDPRIYLTVSYDGRAREKNDLVLEKMKELKEPFSILMLASKDFLKEDPLDIYLTLLEIPLVKSVEIKPYSPNQANQEEINYKAFEEWVKAFITVGHSYHYTLVNEGLIYESLKGLRNSFSDDHLYITPNGKFAVLDFDLFDNEYFLELDTFSDYEEWCHLEKMRVKNNSFCSQCKYLGHCLSEHLREVKDLSNSCNGFFHLLEWASKRI